MPLQGLAENKSKCPEIGGKAGWGGGEGAAQTDAVVLPAVCSLLSWSCGSLPVTFQWEKGAGVPPCCTRWGGTTEENSHYLLNLHAWCCAFTNALGCLFLLHISITSTAQITAARAIQAALGAHPGCCGFGREMQGSSVQRAGVVSQDGQWGERVPKRCCCHCVPREWLGCMTR